MSGSTSKESDVKIFRRLVKQIDDGHYEAARRTCNKLPSDPDAQRTRTWLSIQLEDYSSLNLDGLPTFERAYVNYRLGKPVNTEGAEGRGAMHLQAQVAYRSGEYSKACDIYGALLDECEGEEAEDVGVNLRAAEMGRDWVPPSVDVRWDSAPPSIPTVGIVTEVTVAPGSGRKERKDAGDPERWLKKTERSGYVNKSKGRYRAGGGASQGAVVVEEKEKSTKNVKGGKKKR
ncbi:hypothetical protein CPB85DRAFT_1322524 [Mucidula mucida]|nr:hypothetical protein CPB85DRAFT_1322524 [Mucidula mucida]